MTDETELLPCRCGAKAKIFTVQTGQKMSKQICCTDGNCGLRTPKGLDIDNLVSRWNRPAPKAIDVEALKLNTDRALYKKWCDEGENSNHALAKVSTAIVGEIIDHLNSRGLFGHADQAAIDALKKIHAMPYYLEHVPESQISSLVKRYNKCLDIAEETLQALEKQNDDQ